MKFPKDIMEHTLRVTSTSGKVYQGRGYTYSCVENQHLYGVDEDSLEINSSEGYVSLFESEIVYIEYLD